jgi:desulfoferrodoxin (superoxide reductase-like protein)
MINKLNKIYIFLIFFFIIQVKCELVEKNKEMVKPVKFHTPENEGLWPGKSDNHTPRVTFVKNEPKTINVRIPLKPKKNPRHYIEVIVLMHGNRQIEAKKNSFSFYEATAKFKLPSTLNNQNKYNFWVFAKCNIHGMWKTLVSK